MSLAVDDTHHRSHSRSRSPSGRDRETAGRPAAIITQAPYPGDEDDVPRSPRSPRYEDRRGNGSRSPLTTVDDKYRQAKYDAVEIKSGDSRREKEQRSKERGYDLEKERQRLLGEDKLSFLPAKYATKGAAIKNREREKKQVTYDREPERAYVEQPERERDRPRSSLKKRDSDNSSTDDTEDDENLAYGAVPASSSRRTSSTYDLKYPEYAKPDKYVYAERKSRRGSDVRDDPRRVSEPTIREENKYYSDAYGRDARSSGSNILAVGPGHRSSRNRSRSPLPSKEMARLSVNTLSAGGSHSHSRRGSSLSLSAAPGSPLLESYHGTYQSMSPMPSPIMLASQGPRSSTTDMPAMDINSPESDDERLGTSASGGGGDKIRRRARFYDPETDAQRLAKALRGERHPPDVAPLIEILPGLMHEQVMELRAEYKHIVKTGPDRRGVNLAKHIKARLKDEDPALMKACYTTALGRWESEAYWANFWYHGDKTRRELLIESLMGRTNYEIHQIKNGFSDKKYGDSLSKCMRTELKEDKFKRAVLFVLDEQRMDEVDHDGRPLPLDMELVKEDADNLYRAVRSERGGETAAINVVVQRSDAHLREVLRRYSAQYQSNFARDCLKKSDNLVGEMLAHILNGVINKPVRDAALVHHALTASKRDGLRRELLISRLVRFHWDRYHMAAVKTAYRTRYGRDMQEAIRDATGTADWGLFCRELCIARHPDEVKRVERVDIHHRS